MVSVPSATSDPDIAQAANATAITQFAIFIPEFTPYSHTNSSAPVSSRICPVSKEKPRIAGGTRSGAGVRLRGASGETCLVHVSCHLANLPQLFVGEKNLFLIAHALAV